ncbi:hypothetical protein B0H13DRAFT_2129991 [Mycena leptocephala]|nr:hypothetical protein B0H13DRAFT_2129991 [Mycena leptocephala]
MSSPTCYQRHASLSPRHFERLSMILSESNEHYRAVAAAVRAAKKPTYHARTRAQKLGLGVDIKLAVNCPERQVSYIPLPVIDPTSPVQHRPRGRASGRPTLRLVVPRAQADVPISGELYSTLSLTPGAAVRPAAAPTVLRGQNVPWLGPTSRFSLTPSDPIFTLAPRRAPEPPVVPDVPFDEDDINTWELRYPESGAADYASSSSSYVSSSSCASTSSASSSGPETPADADVIPGLTLSATKRKNDLLDEAADKRPKYARKSWARGRQLC